MAALRGANDCHETRATLADQSPPEAALAGSKVAQGRGLR
jgi:hypothetical protein